jgi:hypothetical protein
MVLRNRFFTFEHSREARLVSRVAQKRKNVDDALAEHLIVAETCDPLHRLVPGDEMAVAIEREYAVDARVDQSSQE